MANAGSALMGIGSARGEDRSVAAAEMAVSSPLLEASIDGAHGVLLSIAGGSDLGLFEINEAAALVSQSAHPEANIIFGATIDDALGDEVRVTVIAAGFDGGDAQATRRRVGLQAHAGPADPGGDPPRRPGPGRREGQERTTRGPPPPARRRQRPEARGRSGPQSSPSTPAPREPRPMQFDDDDLDVPDFLK